MVKRKVCLIVVLFAVGLFATYTVYSAYAINFWTYYPVSEKLEGDEIIKSDVVSNDMVKQARSLGVDFFVYNNEGNESTNTELKIYATYGAIDELKKRFIENCDYSNLVTGDLSIAVLPIESIDRNLEIAEIFYTSDDIQNESVKAFSGYLSKEYGFNEVIEANPDNGIYVVLVVFWGMIFGVLLAMVYYEILSSRKENALIVVLGGNTKGNRIYLISGYLLPMYAFIAIYCCIISFRGIPFFGIQILLCATILFSVVIVSMQAVMSAIDFKRDLSNASNIRRLIKMNWCVRISVSFAGIIVLTVAGVGIFGAFDLSKQSDFFEKHKDYDFYMIYDGENESQAGNFYKEFRKRALGYQKCMNNEPGISEKCPIVFVNSNAIAEMTSDNSDLARSMSGMPDGECNVLISKELYSENNLSYIERCIAFYGLKMERSKNAFIYDYDVSTILLEDMMNNDGATQFVTHNPVIVVVDDNNYEASIYAFSSSNDTMYKITDDELKKACKKYGWDYQYLKETKINAKEGFTLRYNRMKSLSIIGFVLSIVLCVTQLLESVVILKLQYRIKSVEIVLMKITGYGDFKRVRSILNYSLISMLLWIVAGTIVAAKLDYRIGVLLWIIGLITIAVEVIIVIFNLHKADAKNMVGILKGGTL